MQAIGNSNVTNQSHLTKVSSRIINYLGCIL